jgi:serpin B
MSGKLFTAAAGVSLLFSCSNLSISPLDRENHQVATLPNCAANSGNQFAFDLYGRYCGEGKNMVFSPYSITSALTVAFEGARGSTASEMRTVLHLPDDSMKVRLDFRCIDSSLNHPASDSCTLTTANALWAQKDYPFVPAYFAVVQSYYGCGLTNVDFITDPEGARLMINAWVETKTNSRIKDIIPPDALGAATRLVISNAVYFKSNWERKFDSAATDDGAFTLESGAPVTVKMMHQTEHFNYAETENFQILEMQYRGGDVSMVFLLPKTSGLSSVETSVTGGKLAYWLKSMENMEVIVSIPRFKLETNYSLGGDLTALGMNKAFDANKADFSGMSAVPGLYIAGVLHKVFIEVCEAETEAAAATVVIIMCTSSISTPKPPPKVFTADRPFMFLIQHKPTGSILFLGKVENPTGQQ